MKIKSIVILLACLLLLSSLTMPAIACDCEGDPPGECYVCEAGVWVQDGDCWDGCPDCEECVDCYCECLADCGCGGKTCTGCCECESCSCADKNDNCTGECHNGCSGCSCVDDESKCADCMSCIGGECYDVQCKVILGNCQRCNETTGECEYSCSDEGCGEICVDNECVPDCDSVGSYCDWTFPPIQSNCPGTNIDDLSCAPGVTGKTCAWKVVQSFSHSATGPCKESGGFCATLEPVICKDKFLPTMGMVCSCTGTPALVNYQYRTFRYKCPGDPW